MKEEDDRKEKKGKRVNECLLINRLFSFVKILFISIMFNFVPSSLHLLLSDSSTTHT